MCQNFLNALHLPIEEFEKHQAPSTAMAVQLNEILIIWHLELHGNHLIDLQRLDIAKDQSMTATLFQMLVVQHAAW